MISGGTPILANQPFDVHQLLVTLVALATQIAMFLSFPAKSQTFPVMSPNSIENHKKMELKPMCLTLKHLKHPFFSNVPSPKTA